MSSLIAVLSLQSTANAAVLLVPDNFTAQAAVNAAANGDIIQFNTAVVEDFTVTGGKVLTFQGAGSWIGTLSATAGANITITGMTLAGGTTTFDPLAIATGQYCETASLSAVAAVNATVTVIDSSFICYSAAAINALDSSVDVTGSQFQYNYFLGGIYAVGGDLTVGTSDFSYNAAFEGGGIRAETDNATITGTTFYANTTALGGGGGLYVAADTAFVSQNEFLNNYNLLWWIPGLVVNDPSDLLGQDVGGLVVGTGQGAGMFVTDPALAPATSVVIHDNTFCGNLSDAGSGLYVDDVMGVEIKNNRFADNWSMHFGGGMYIKANAPWDETQQAHVLNNTFLMNTAGLFPPPFPQVVTVIGGGGGLAFDGTVVDFRNNILAYTPFGGGIMGIDGPDYVIGDLVTVSYNEMFWNCDTLGCDGAIPTAWQSFTGDMNAYALPSNNLQLDPFPVYFGGGEFNCVPDAFYPQWDSPAVRNGDPSLPNIYSPDFSDMGAYGGPDANVLDRDADGFENIYDCNDEDVDLNPVDGIADGFGIYPGAPEACDGYDNDCDGLIDEGFDTLWYPDEDRDGYGDLYSGQPVFDCVDRRPEYQLNRTDCSDDNPDVHPGQAEICNMYDDDCDLAINGGLPFLALFQDLDDDGFGAGTQYDGCLAQDDEAGPGHYYITGTDGVPQLKVEGYVENHDDCNDFDINVSPVAVEICDQKDNDCNLIVDDSSQDGQLFYTDGDHDGYGTTESGGYSCDPPGVDSVLMGGDCDDFDRELNPAAAEICDTIDNDCDGTTDKNAQNAELLYEDLDADGYGNPSTAARDCNPGPTYTTRVGGDCDDNDPTVGRCNACGGCNANPSPVGAGAIVSLLLAMGWRRRKLV